MLQFVFLCEKVSVAAAKREISVELEVGADELAVLALLLNSSGLEVLLVDCSGPGDGGGVGGAAPPDESVGCWAFLLVVVVVVVLWDCNVLMRFSMPRILGTR